MTPRIKFEPAHYNLANERAGEAARARVEGAPPRFRFWGSGSQSSLHKAASGEALYKQKKSRTSADSEARQEGVPEGWWGKKSRRAHLPTPTSATVVPGARSHKKSSA
jgi:hypothetical protein